MITLSDFKRYANINNTAEDGKISATVDAANAVAKEYTGKTFEAGTKTAKLNPTSTNYLVLPDPQIATIVSITFLASGEWNETNEVYDDLPLLDTEYYLDLDGTIELIGVIQPTSQRSIVVEYTLPTSVPSDLKLAVMELAHYYFKREYNVSQQIAGQDVDFRDKNILPTQVKTIFDLHKWL